MKIHLVCAARPNFMKVAPLYHALRKEAWAKPVIVHTEQHYDRNMSGAESYRPGLAGTGHPPGREERFACRADRQGHDDVREDAAGAAADLVVVVGDVNSTMAAAITA